MWRSSGYKSRKGKIVKEVKLPTTLKKSLINLCDMEWIKITDELPERLVWVSVKRDGEWETMGRLSMSNKWNIKATTGLSLNNSFPTHWAKR